MSEILKCHDCRFCKPFGGGILRLFLPRFFDVEPACTHPSGEYVSHCEVHRGKPPETRNRLCSSMRSDEGRCGLKARFFEPRKRP